MILKHVLLVKPIPGGGGDTHLPSGKMTVFPFIDIKKKSCRLSTGNHDVCLKNFIYIYIFVVAKTAVRIQTADEDSGIYPGRNI